MREPLIKAHDISHVVYEHPDLDLIERFLSDFGLVTCERSADALHMRGAIGSQPIYRVRKGAASRFCGVAFRAGSREDLEKLRAHPTASGIETIEGPGGGEQVTVVDPNGFRIAVVFGIEGKTAQPRRAVVPLNYGTEKLRRGEPQRLEKRAPEVLRLGHVGMNVLDFRESLDFYSNVLGMRVSDQLFDGDEKNLVGGFIRCDRGDEWSDHHSLALFQHARRASVHHVSFEMQDMDSVLYARDWMSAKGWTPYWGVGRHVLGSQVFDYWRDPFGNLVEHYADGDVCNSSTQQGTFQRSADLRKAWGPEVPSTFMD